MPYHRREPARPPQVDPADWRPQAFGGKGLRAMSDPIIEPSWTGLRVIARAGRGPDGTRHATLTDDKGVDCTAEFEALAGTIAAAALADELVLDGWLSVEPTQGGQGIEMALVETPTQRQMFAQMIGGGKLRQDEPVRELDMDTPIAFVAVDLLAIDGSTLIEVPLLERKRLLDGALKVGELVRITPYIRPPVGSMAVTWRALGFREMVYKPANGHYLPTGKPSDWATAPIITR
jgi:ATP-dependent DNA ligase